MQSLLCYLIAPVWCGSISVWHGSISVFVFLPGTLPEPESRQMDSRAWRWASTYAKTRTGMAGEAAALTTAMASIMSQPLSCYWLQQLSGLPPSQPPSQPGCWPTSSPSNCACPLATAPVPANGSGNVPGRNNIMNTDTENHVMLQDHGILLAMVSHSIWYWTSCLIVHMQARPNCCTPQR